MRRLTGLGRRRTVVPWGDHGVGHEGRPRVLHVLTGGLEPVSSRSEDMAARLDAVRAAVDTADQGGCSIVGICLGAQMIATVVSDLIPRPVGGGEEARLTLVTACDPDVPDLGSERDTAELPSRPTPG